MHEFGTKSEQLAAVAVTMRRHAALNANATMRKPITTYDAGVGVLGGEAFSPFRLLFGV